MSKIGFGEAEINQVHEVEEHGYGLFFSLTGEPTQGRISL